MFSAYLKAKGHDCAVSNDSKVGLNKIFQENFDLVLLDLAMPELSGFDIVEKLKKSGKINQTKIVIFSAKEVTEKQISDLLERGVYAFLKKPVKLEALRKILEKIDQNNLKDGNDV